MKPVINMYHATLINKGSAFEALQGYVDNHPSWPTELHHGPVMTTSIQSKHDGLYETRNTRYRVITWC